MEAQAPTKESLLEALNKATTHAQVDKLAEFLEVAFVEGTKVADKKAGILKTIEERYNNPSTPDTEPSNSSETEPETTDDNGDDNEDEEGDKDESDSNSSQIEFYRGVQVLRKSEDVRYGKRYIDFETIDGVGYSIPKTEYKEEVKVKEVK